MDLAGSRPPSSLSHKKRTLNPLKVGETLDSPRLKQLKIVQEIASGGQACVYEALVLSSTNNFPVALKVTHQEHAQSHYMEARAMTILSHAGGSSPALFDQFAVKCIVDDKEEVYYVLVMEIFSWKSLSHWGSIMKSRQFSRLIMALHPFRHLAIRWITSQLISALRSLHTSGLWNGDMSPSNVLVKVAPFAIPTGFKENGHAARIFTGTTVAPFIPLLFRFALADFGGSTSIHDRHSDPTWSRAIHTTAIETTDYNQGSHNGHRKSRHEQVFGAEDAIQLHDILEFVLSVLKSPQSPRLDNEREEEQVSEVMLLLKRSICPMDQDLLTFYSCVPPGLAIAMGLAIAPAAYAVLCSDLPTSSRSSSMPEPSSPVPETNPRPTHRLPNPSLPVPSKDTASLIEPDLRVVHSVSNTAAALLDMELDCSRPQGTDKRTVATNPTQSTETATPSPDTESVLDGRVLSHAESSSLAHERDDSTGRKSLQPQHATSSSSLRNSATAAISLSSSVPSSLSPAAAALALSPPFTRPSISVNDASSSVTGISSSPIILDSPHLLDSTQEPVLVYPEDPKGIPNFPCVVRPEEPIDWQLPWINGSTISSATSWAVGCRVIHLPQPMNRSELPSFFTQTLDYLVDSIYKSESLWIANYVLSNFTAVLPQLDQGNAKQSHVSTFLPNMVSLPSTDENAGTKEMNQLNTLLGLAHNLYNPWMRYREDAMMILRAQVFLRMLDHFSEPSNFPQGTLDSIDLQFFDALTDLFYENEIIAGALTRNQMLWCSSATRRDSSPGLTQEIITKLMIIYDNEVVLAINNNCPWQSFMDIFDKLRRLAHLDPGLSSLCYE